MKDGFQNCYSSFKRNMRNSVPGQIFHVLVFWEAHSSSVFVWHLNQTLLVNYVVCVADRFWMVPINEPTILLSAFVDRFKSACLLEQQLPAMKPEQLKAMVWCFFLNKFQEWFFYAFLIFGFSYSSDLNWRCCKCPPTADWRWASETRWFSL